MPLSLKALFPKLGIVAMLGIALADYYLVLISSALVYYFKISKVAVKERAVDQEVLINKIVNRPFSEFMRSTAKIC